MNDEGKGCCRPSPDYSSRRRGLWDSETGAKPVSLELGHEESLARWGGGEGDWVGGTWPEQRQGGRAQPALYGEPWFHRVP